VKVPNGKQEGGGRRRDSSITTTGGKRVAPVSRKEDKPKMRRTGFKMSKFILSFICIGIFWAAGPDFSWVPNAAAQAQRLFQYSKPQAVPTFSVQNLDGKGVDIRDHRDQVVLLNFWATW
jgi:hypothetical protein